jgi:hypothetical protein
MFKILSKLFFAGAVATEPVMAAEDHFERTIGIHLLSNYGSEYSFLSESISQEYIEREIRKLDWHNSFNQFIVIIDPGVMMEVGGSLDPTDGLSARYLNRNTREEAVIVNPPESVSEMEDILIKFTSGSDSWKTDYSFDFVTY